MPDTQTANAASPNKRKKSKQKGRKAKSKAKAKAKATPEATEQIEEVEQAQPEAEAAEAEEGQATASLDELVAALGGEEGEASESVGQQADGETDEDDGTVRLQDELPMEPDDDLSEVDGEASARLVSIIESLLFAANKPMSVREIRKVLKEPTTQQVQLAVKHLMTDTAERGIVLGQVAGGFRFRTHPANAAYVQRMLSGKPTRLSRSQLEALAVIAYRQPITKAEVDHVRGVDCSAVIRVLLERDLAKIVGRKEEPGRPHLYGTTVKFLEFFNLRSLRDIPDLHEFAELSEESEAALRDRLGDEAAEQEAMGQETLGLDSEPRDEAEGVQAEDGEPQSATSEEEAALDDEPVTHDDAGELDDDALDGDDAEGTDENAVAPDEDEAPRS